jgi:hypothetical protein
LSVGLVQEGSSLGIDAIKVGKEDSHNFSENLLDVLIKARREVLKS